jgi:hypothetical protein
MVGMTCVESLFMRSTHDYNHLIKRWRAVARAARLQMRAFAEESGREVFCVTSPALDREGGIYISAGIHGDEPAAPEALIVWAEKNIARIGRLPLMIFPCLNPWGLLNNTRCDEAGCDLNRVFQHDEARAVRAQKRLIAGHRFAVALSLHEDYDAGGVYLYEIEGARPFWGEALLAKAVRILPPDPRTMIERRRARGGLIRRKVDPGRFRKMGFPEAVYLHLNHAERSLTFETPSEFAIERRVRAHVAVIEEMMRRCCGRGLRPR